MFWPFNRKGRFSKTIEIKAPAVIEPPKPVFRVVEKEEDFEIVALRTTVEMKSGKKYCIEITNEAWEDNDTRCLVHGYRVGYRYEPIMPVKLRNVRLQYSQQALERYGETVTFTDTNKNRVTVSFSDIEAIIEHPKVVLKIERHKFDVLEILE